MNTDQRGAKPLGTFTRRSALVSVPGLAVLLAACAGDEDPRVTTQGRTIDTDLPYLEVSSAPGVPVVDLLLDFRCPPCAAFAAAHTDTLAGAAQDGRITLRVRPRPMLDKARGTTYSADTASAAAAVYAQDPALLMPFEKAMFAAQAPTPDDPDPTLDQIAEIARGVGADETAIAQIKDRTYVDWATDVVEPPLRDQGFGTPTVLIDNVRWEGDWSVPGELESALGLPVPSDGGGSR